MNYGYAYLIGVIGCTILFSIAHNMSDENAIEFKSTRETEKDGYKEFETEEGQLQIKSAVVVVMAIFWPITLPFSILNSISRVIIKIGR